MAKRKSQKDKQRSTKHTYKTKDRVLRAPLKTEGELRCFGKIFRWQSYALLVGQRNNLLSFSKQVYG
jgi:hypothetical protein